MPSPLGYLYETVATFPASSKQPLNKALTSVAPGSEFPPHPHAGGNQSCIKQRFMGRQPVHRWPLQTDLAPASVTLLSSGRNSRELQTHTRAFLITSSGEHEKKRQPWGPSKVGNGGPTRSGGSEKAERAPNAGSLSVLESPQLNPHAGMTASVWLAI